MLFTTTDYIEGRKIGTYFSTQFVTKNTVISLNYAIKAQSILNKCKQELMENAEKTWGAQAIIGARVNTASHGNELIVTVYGTPVKFE